METQTQTPPAQPENVAPTQAPEAQTGPVILTAAEGGTYLPDGNYRGLITNITLRESKKEETGEVFTYVDFTIIEKASGGDLRLGFPARLTPKSDLGQFFTAFGLNVPAPGTPTNLNELFGSKEVAFMARNETNAQGTFTRIVKGSVRPVGA